MTLIHMSISRGTNTILSMLKRSVMIDTKNRKFKTVISQNQDSLRIMASRGTKIIQIKKIQKNTDPKKFMFIVGNRGTKSSIIPITN